MAVILHVTPAEWRWLTQLADQDRRAGTDDLAAWCQARYGCQASTSYTVVVRRDVPSVPWLSAGVARLAGTEP